MIEQPPEHWWVYLRAAGYALFAAIAGALGYVLRSMDSGMPVTFARTFVEALSAGFVGVVMMWLCQVAGLSPQWTGIIVAVSGWLGANATIQVVQRLVWNKLGLNPKDVDHDSPT